MHISIQEAKRENGDTIRLVEDKFPRDTSGLKRGAANPLDECHCKMEPMKWLVND